MKFLPKHLITIHKKWPSSNLQQHRIFIRNKYYLIHLRVDISRNLVCLVRFMATSLKKTLHYAICFKDIFVQIFLRPHYRAGRILKAVHENLLAKEAVNYHFRLFLHFGYYKQWRFRVETLVSKKIEDVDFAINKFLFC